MRVIKAALLAIPVLFGIGIASSLLAPKPKYVPPHAWVKTTTIEP